MGINFTKPPMEPQPQNNQMVPVNNNSAIEEVKSYDIVAERETLNAQLVNSQEVDALVSQIDISNIESIVSFGAKAAEEISKASDIVLRNANMSQLDDSSMMLNALAKIMEQFDSLNFNE